MAYNLHSVLYMKANLTKALFYALLATILTASNGIAANFNRNPNNSISQITTIEKSNAKLDSFDKWEVRTAPVMMVAAWYTLDLSYQLTPNWSTGPAAVFYQNDHVGGMLMPADFGQALGWQQLYTFKPMKAASLYVSSHVYYQSYSSAGDAQINSRDQHDGIKVNSDFGIRWHEHHFIMLAGAGVEYIDEQRRQVYNQNAVIQPELRVPEHSASLIRTQSAT